MNRTPVREDAVDWLRQTVAAKSSKPFLIDAATGTVLSFAEFHGQALGISSQLRERKLQKGDRVAVIADNSAALAAFYFGCLFAGVSVVPINPTSTEEEIDYILGAARVKALALSQAVENRHDLPSLKKRKLIALSLEPLASAPSSSKTIAFDGVTENDEALVVFTSGTTSSPKGVVHRIGNLVRNARMFGERVGLQETNRFYHLLPMTYLGGYYNLLLLPYVWRASVVLGPVFGPKAIFDFWKPVIQHDVDTLWLVPSILSLLLKMDRRTEGEQYCRQNIKLVLCGTAPLPLALKAEFEKRYGVRAHQNFALSETLFLTTHFPGSTVTRNSVGTVLPSVKLKIVDAKGDEVAVGEEGEITVQTPFLMTGYQDPSTGQPAPLSANAWFPTGDVGKFAEGGELFITGRKKDLIIRGGINLSPAAIEELIYTHPAVIDCAVVGSPDPVLGEEVTAVIKCDPTSDFSKVVEEIKKSCEQRLAKFKWPARYVELPDFPRTASGKIQKNKIRGWLTQKPTASGGAAIARTAGAPEANFLRPSKVVQGIVEAMSIKFNTLVYEAKQRKEDVITLSLGEAFFDIPLFKFDDLPFPELYHYSHPRGIPELRKALADYFLQEYEVAFDAEKEILVTAGSKIAIYMTLLALLNPDDEVLVLEPAWVSYFEQIKLCHAIPVSVPYQDGIADLHRYITNRTRVIIINSPNNPSGKIYTLEELSTLYQLAKKHGLYILSDEAYSDFLLEPQQFLSMGNLDTAKTHTVIVNSISKNFGISGWRVGYLITNAALTNQILKLNQHLVTCPPTILSQYIAKHFAEVIAITKPQIRAVVERRADLANYMDGLGLTYLAGEATFYFFVSLGDSRLSSEEFCYQLIREHHVCAVPGIGYGASCDRFIRVSVGTESMERIKQGLTRIRSLIRATANSGKTEAKRRTA